MHVSNTRHCLFHASHLYIQPALLTMHTSTNAHPTRDSAAARLRQGRQHPKHPSALMPPLYATAASSTCTSTGT